MLSKSARCLTAVLLVALGGGRASAGPVYTFAIDRANYDVAPGGTADVKVYLQESGGGTLLHDFGLLGAGVLVRTTAPVPSQPARVLTTTDILVNGPPPNGTGGPFDGLVSFLLTSNTAGLMESVDLTSPPVQDPGAGPTYQIYLAPFHFTAGGVPGEVTHLSAGRTASDSQDNVVADWPPNAMPTVLDGLIQPGPFSTATITVQGGAVPEPAGMVLLLVGGLAVLAGRRWQCPRGGWCKLGRVWWRLQGGRGQEQASVTR